MNDAAREEVKKMVAALLRLHLSDVVDGLLTALVTAMDNAATKNDNRADAETPPSVVIEEVDESAWSAPLADYRPGPLDGGGDAVPRALLPIATGDTGAATDAARPIDTSRMVARASGLPLGGARTRINEEEKEEEGAWGGTDPRATGEAAPHPAPARLPPPPRATGANATPAAPPTPSVDRWRDLEVELGELADHYRETAAWERDLFDRFDRYRQHHGDAADPASRRWAKEIANKREELVAAQRAREVRRDREQALEAEKRRARADLEKKRKERERLEALAQEAAVKARLRLEHLERQLKNAARQEDFARRQLEQREAALEKNSGKIKHCFVCNYPGVNDSRKCPRKNRHHEFHY